MSTVFEHAYPRGNTAVWPGILRRWALFVLVSFIAGSLPPSSLEAKEPIKIGVSLGLTGRFAVMSGALQKGFRLWERNVNAEGGILGRPVRLICQDDHGSPETARSVYVKLIDTDKVDFLFAPYSSMITEAVLPIAQQHDIPILVAGAAADRLWEQGFHNVIGVYPPASKFTIGFLELLVLNDLDGIAVVYADDSFSVDLARTAKEIYDICDGNFTKLTQSGQLTNPKVVRIRRTLTLGAIEDYAKRYNLSLALKDDGQRTLLAYNIDPALNTEINGVDPETTTATLRVKDHVYYFHHFNFKPWNWHFELINDTTLYAPLFKRVKAVYVLTAVVLLAGLSAILLALDRALRYPVERIITAVREKRPPAYRGIYEFEFLSHNIAGMMTSLRERTEWLERLYTIGAANRGEVFFNNIARAIADAMDLNTIITRSESDGGGFRIVAVAPVSDGRFKREDLEAGLPYDRTVHQTEPTVVLRGAAEHFSGFRGITGSAVECYIGLPVTNREGHPIGCVHLFGTAREVDDWDMNFIKTAGRMVGLEFELMEKEREQEQIREQMFHAQKLESLGLLAGGMAHDFNNLLMGIQGRASLMLDDASTPQTNIEHIQAIEEYVNRAAELTRQLLGFARGGKYDIKPADINAVLDDSAQMFGRTKKEISIQTDFAPDLRPVEVDRRQIEQVFLNLFVNAWHAMPGGGKLIITTANVFLDEAQVEPHEVPPGLYVKISVTDTGIGMDEASLKKIFDPFFTTRQMGRGTGLGLAMVYGIVKNHMGLITVHSQVGKGSTFTICLPASDKEIVAETNSDERKLTGSETVLLVDDEAMIIEVGKKLLANLGYQVFAASGGKEAVEIFREKHNGIQLVIMDMIMPDVSGGETFDRLREIQPNVKVLLSSGYSLDAQTQAILNRGCKGFIQKPFNMNELSREIRKILDKENQSLSAALEMMNR